MERLTIRDGEHTLMANMDLSKHRGDACTALLAKLAIYEDAEENGTLIRLPCKIGDIVYNIIPERDIISTLEITAIKIYKSGLFFEWNLIDGIYKYIAGFEEFELNKTVFLTEAEAREALEAERREG